MQPLKIMIFHSFFTITVVWDLIETWGFCLDDHCDTPDIPILLPKKIIIPNITQPTAKQHHSFNFSGPSLSFGPF